MKSLLPIDLTFKTSLKFFGVVMILFIILCITINTEYLDSYLREDFFNGLKQYLFLDTNNSINQSNQFNQSNQSNQSNILNLQHSLGRNGSVYNIKNYDSHYLNLNKSFVFDSSTLFNNKHLINTKQLGYINRLVQLKYGSLSLVPSLKDNSLHFRNVKLDAMGYKLSCFKIILGLANPNYISIYHPELDQYICRDPDGNLFLTHTDLINENVINSFSFKLFVGPINNNKVLISCPFINTENTHKLWHVKKDLLNVKYMPFINSYNKITDFGNCEFQFVDCHSGISLGTKYEGVDLEMKNNTIDRTAQATGIISNKEQAYGLHLPKFFNNTTNDHSSINIVSNNNLNENHNNNLNKNHNNNNNNLNENHNNNNNNLNENHNNNLNENHNNNLNKNHNNNLNKNHNNNLNNVKELFTSGLEYGKSKIRNSIASLCKETSLLSNSGLNCKKIIGNSNLYKPSINKQSLDVYSSDKNETFQNINTLEDVGNTENDLNDELKPNSVFGKLTGGEAEDILNMDLVGKNYSELLSDGLMERLQKAKLDPNVQNLLDYNETLYNVYLKENKDYDDKLTQHKEKHINDVDNRIRQANNYRVNQMSRDLFNAENILKDKNEI